MGKSHKLPGAASRYVGGEDIRQELHDHLRMGNRTAIFYVNHMGGTWSPTMSRLVIQFWQWCLAKNVSLSAEYLPGPDNGILDKESRRIQSSAEWKLKQKVLQQIMMILGKMLNGPVCLLAQCLADAVCELEARSECKCNRYSAPSVEQVDGHWRRKLLKVRGTTLLN